MKEMKIRGKEKMIKRYVTMHNIYPVCAEVDTLEVVSKLLVEHGLVAVASAAGQKRAVHEGSFWMRWFPREVRSTRVCKGSFNTPSGHDGAVTTLEQYQSWHPRFYSVPPRQSCLEKLKKISLETSSKLNAFLNCPFSFLCYINI